MKQPRISLKDASTGEELGVFTVFLVQWNEIGKIDYLKCEYGVGMEISMFYLNERFVNSYGNIIGTLINEEGTE